MFGLMFFLFEILFWFLIIWAVIKSIKTRNSRYYGNNDRNDYPAQGQTYQKNFNTQKDTNYTQGNAGKNGDYGDVPSDSERMAVCKYCGAKNIIPKYANTTYNCYFCRQIIE